jgi:hypothetical protein
MHCLKASDLRNETPAIARNLAEHIPMSTQNIAETFFRITNWNPNMCVRIVWFGQPISLNDGGQPNWFSSPPIKRRNKADKAEFAGISRVPRPGKISFGTFLNAFLAARHLANDVRFGA